MGAGNRIGRRKAPAFCKPGAGKRALLCDVWHCAGIAVVFLQGADWILAVLRLRNRVHSGGVDCRPSAGAAVPREMVGLLWYQVESGRVHMPSRIPCLGDSGRGCHKVGEQPVA